jgi:tetratricopeptide (TPR) repeat protein
MFSPITIDPLLLDVLVAGLFVLVFGFLSYTRREGLSTQFALEAIGLAAILLGGGYLLGVIINPLLLLLLLYLVTLRSRLIVDLANVMAQRHNYKLAYRLYALGLAWWPDSASRLIVLANRGAAELHAGQNEDAIKTIEGVLKAGREHHLGIKYEAACRYNLAVAYDRSGQPAKATQLYNEVVELLPGSVYARAAGGALKRRREAPKDQT